MRNVGVWLIAISVIYLILGMINLFAIQFIDIMFLQMFYIAALLGLLLFKYKSERPSKKPARKANMVRSPDGKNITVPMRDIVRPKNPPPAPPKVRSRSDWQ
jgi:hypothetical protein